MTKIGVCVFVLSLAACSDGTMEVPDGGTIVECPTGTLRGQTLSAGDGQEDRFYWLHVPASYDCETAMPLLLDFHGTSGPVPEEAFLTDGMIAFSEAHGVIVARPRSRSAAFQGGEIYRWDQNTGDLARNATFSKNLVGSLSERYRIDPARVYASGFSTGSNMVSQFLSDGASPFKGLAPIAGGRWTTTALPSLIDGPRIYGATGYRDYLWPYARSLVEETATAGLPPDRVFLRRTGGGHGLYAWHFEELWQFLDEQVRPGAGTVTAPWTATTLPSASDVLALAKDGNDLVAAGARGRVWRQSGSAWQVELDRGAVDYTALCFGPQHALVGGNYSVAIRSGTTWGAHSGVPDHGGQLGAGWINGAACRADGSMVVVGYWSASVTSNGGAQWSKFGVPTGFGYESQVAAAVEAPGGATVVVGYYDYVGVASSAAVSAASTPHPTSAEWWNAAAATANGRFWVVGDGGLIASSSDNGATWSARTSGTQENLYAVHFADAQHGAAVGRRGAVVVTSDGGAHWAARPLGKDAFLGAVHVDATTITVAGEDGLVATSPR